ncbi:MAG: hypothetical protein HY597_07290 [Candidatus Omnitrophica bacterium]|nr:hypothetical protein [Candidatus Omnitrophota bacterium]
MLSLQPGWVWAASSQHFVITQDAFASGAGVADSANFQLTMGALGEPVGGISASPSYRLVGGYAVEVAEPTPGSRTITVEGTIDDPTATVLVNGRLAAVVGNAWAASGVPLVEGENALTVTATDPLGNAASRTITVYLDTHPPARPTVERGTLGTNVAPNTYLTDAPPSALGGTKIAGTSVWINGVQVVPLDGSTTWSVNYPLQEGDNVLAIVTKDAAGNASTSEEVVIVVDRLSPVITVTAPPQPYKTNLSPLTVIGTVDDRLTTVNVNGTPASRNVLGFQVELPLTLGPNSFTITAGSQLGHVSTKRIDVTRGTMPSITSVIPSDASKVYVGQSVNIGATATDAEGDPLESQILVNGAVLVDWVTNATYPWLPGDAAAGMNTIEVRVRDAFGGYTSQQAEVFVLRNPVSPP